MFHNNTYCVNFRKFGNVELVLNLHPNYPPYQFLHIFTNGKIEILDFFELMAGIQIYFCVKPQTKNSFQKDVERRVLS